MSKFDFIFIDFDRTLFDSIGFRKWCDKILTTKYGLNEGILDNSVHKYLAGKSELEKVYDHTKHFLDTFGHGWDKISGDIEHQMFKENISFLYPDAREFLKKAIANNKDVRILTYGNPGYQMFKVRMCPELAILKIPVHVSSTRKSKFLEDYYKSHHIKNGVLIDDKYPLDLPKNWHHICVDRYDKISTKKNNQSVTFVSGLKEVDL
jgi:hypothetical protein